MTTVPILAVDPGGTTGWVWWNGDAVTTAYQAAPMSFLRVVDIHIEATPNLVIVCERYLVTPDTAKKSPQPEAMEVIGALRYLAHRYGRGFELQGTDIKSFATNDKLKAVELWPRGMVHAQDACRHLLVALLKRGWTHPGLDALVT